jgi:hypothetical protein
MESELGSAEWFSVESKKLLRRIGMAALEALAFGASVLFHVGMQRAINGVIPDGYHYVHELLEGVVATVFGLIYVVIAIDTLIIFIPAFEGMKNLIEGKSRRVEPIQKELFSDTKTTE